MFSTRFLVFQVAFTASLVAFLSGCFGTQAEPNQAQSPYAKESKKSEIITLSFVGDNVLGDYYGSNGETFNWRFAQQKGDYSYFFAKVKEVLENDDMSLGNLEGPLTTHNNDRLVKPFAFKGDPSYVKILQEGSIEAVNIAKIGRAHV